MAEQGAALFHQGNDKQAVEYFDLSIDLEPDGLPALWVTVMKASIEGNIELGLNVLRKFEEANLLDGEAWYDFAGNYGLLGDRDGCIQALHGAVDGGFFNYPFMLIDSFLDSVRDDAEFQMILQRSSSNNQIPIRA